MNILSIGCGNMAQAILIGMMSASYFSQHKSKLFILKPSADNKLESLYQAVEKNNIDLKIKATNSIQDIISNVADDTSNNAKQDDSQNIDKVVATQNITQIDIVIIAVKPQKLNQVVEEYKLQDNFKNSIFVSILAGKDMNALENTLGNDKKIIRMMPNLAVEFCSGIVAWNHNQNLLETEKQLFCDLFDNLGTVICTTDVEIDKYTVFAGSAPAFLYYIIEQFIQTGQTVFDLDEKHSSHIVMQVVNGAVAYLKQKKLSPQNAIEKVASKGGTTEAGLNVLKEKQNLTQLVQKTMKTAWERNQYLKNS